MFQKLDINGYTNLTTEIEVLNNNNDLFSINAEDLKIEKNDKKIKKEEEILSLLRNEPLPKNSRFGLKLEAYVLKLAYAHNKILSLSNSRTKILAHQVESTHIIVNSLNHRYMIADEVGLGKTIEAGLVIKELVYRYNYKNIMISCPAPLVVQWQNELMEKFGERFEIVNRKVLDKKRKEIGEDDNPWNYYNKVICSMDFIKNPALHEELKDTKWDAVVFDEAHRLRRDSQTSTLTYDVADLLTERSRAFLLLTATPFRGKLEELYYLVKLVDKNLLGPFQSFYRDFCMPDSDLSILKEKLSSVILRRTKKEIGGFTERKARTIRFDLYPEERELYDATTRYVVEEFNRAQQTQNRAVGFVMCVFQKLLDSSSYALFSALKNRRQNLVNKLNNVNNRIDLEFEADEFLEEFAPELLTETEDVDKLFEDSLTKTVKEMEEEISTLTKLVDLAGSITRNKKGEKLKEMIATLKAEGHKKFLIFTQFKTTQDYLKEILPGYKLEVFHGSMDMMQKEKAVEDFKGDSEILICTEAGCEGRNMQFCNILFNYDLPWSPLKIEQRIGRLHRFGQKYDVFVYNFSTKDTVAERVLDVLAQKLSLFEESIGEPDITLGQIEDEVKLNSLFMDMTAGKKSKEEIDGELNKSITMAKKSFEKLNDLTVTQKMDFNYDEYYRITQKERRFSNKQLEFFIDRFIAVEDYGKTLLEKVPEDKTLFRVKTPGSEPVVGTFDSEKALSDYKLEFLAFGHPAVNDSISYCKKDQFGGLTGYKVVNETINSCGMLFNFIVRFKSIDETREVMPIFVDMDGTLSDMDLSSIEEEVIHQVTGEVNKQDLEEYSDRVNTMISHLEDHYERAKSRLFSRIEDKVWDLKENLDLTIDPEIEKIKESYSKQIKELQDKMEIQENQMIHFGKDMKSAISRTRNRIEKARREQDHLLAKYRRYLGVTYEVEMVSAGVVIAKD